MQKRTETTEADKRQPRTKTAQKTSKAIKKEQQQEERHWVIFPEHPDKLSTRGKIAWLYQELTHIDQLIKHIDQDIKNYPPMPYTIAFLSRSHLTRYAYSLCQRLEKEKRSLALQEQPENGKVFSLANYRKKKESVMREQATPQELARELLARSERMLATLQSMRKELD